jgi:hypothetical protein
VSIDRGENYHGSLLEEFYLVIDNPADPVLVALWMADTGSQDDDDQARLWPVAWACYSDLWDEEAGGLSETAAAVLLYAYIGAAAEAWGEGYYTDDNEVFCPDDQKTDLFAQIFTDALSGNPLRLPGTP